MDYNKELEQLKAKEHEIIEKAKKVGYKLINDELIKDKFIPVIEIYARGETQYESSGSYFVFKKVVALTSEQLEFILKINQTEDNLVDFIYESFLTNTEGLDSFYRIISLFNAGELESKYINNVVKKDQLGDYYYLNEGQKLYMEFTFNDENVDGYISVFDMRSDDFEKQKNIDLYFKKYLIFN